MELEDKKRPKEDIENYEDFIDLLSDKMAESRQKSDEQKEFEKQFFSDLEGIDQVDRFLRDTMARDVLRYYNAQTEANRNQIKGHFSFANYMYHMIKKARD